MYLPIRRSLDWKSSLGDISLTVALIVLALTCYKFDVAIDECSSWHWESPAKVAKFKKNYGFLPRRNTPKLAPDEIQQHLPSLPAWRLIDDGKKMRREFVARNFVQAIKFLNGVADVAEAEGHHPDLHLTEYRTVAIEVWTHAIGGISMHDVVLAAKVDAVPVEYSKKWVE